MSVLKMSSNQCIRVIKFLNCNRHLISTPMPKRNTESQSISSVLQDFLTGSKLEKGLTKVTVESAWHQVMGPPITKYTKSLRWAPPTLHVYLSSSVLREELHYGKEKIIDLMNQELGESLVKSIIFK